MLLQAMCSDRSPCWWERNGWRHQ